MEKSLLKIVADNLHLNEDDTSAVIDEFMLQLHRKIIEYKGLNGDYIGEQLHWEIGKQAFFHFLGFLDHFSDKYNWEKGIATEYILRLGKRADWLPYSHQIDDIKEK